MLNIANRGETSSALANFAIGNLALRMLTEPVNASLPTNDKIAQLIGHQLVIAREHADGDGQIETRPGNSAPPS